MPLRLLHTLTAAVLWSAASAAAAADAPEPAASSTPAPGASSPAGGCCKCRIVPLKMRAINWSGSVTYRAVITVTGGAVSDIQLEAIPKAPPRREHKEFVAMIEEGIRAAKHCPGDYSLTQEYAFHIQ